MKNRKVIAAVPIACVNLTASLGQFEYIRSHVHWPFIGALMLAATLESVAVYLGYESHLAMRKGDSSLGLRAASYGTGIIVGLMNLSHYSPSLAQPTFLGIATGVLSALSPWLWGIYSRRVGRDHLAAMGLIEKRSVRFARVRWVMFPVRTFGAFRLAVWRGITDPGKAITQWERETSGEPVNPEPARMRVPANPDNALIRQWANSHGYELASRGRIPGAVRTAYESAIGVAAR